MLVVSWAVIVWIYFGQIGNTIVLLLCGGDQSTQKQDIHQAQQYWKDYEKRTHPRER